MSQWSVEGVDQKTQNLAGLAATRAGLSVGKWLDREIRLKTGVPLVAEPGETVLSDGDNGSPTPAAKATTGPRPQSRSARPVAPPEKSARSRRLPVFTAIILLALAGGFSAWQMDLMPKDVTDRISALLKDGSDDRAATPEKRSAETATPEIPAAMPLDRLEKAAGTGDTAAQVELGKRLMEGRGVGRDFTRARKLFEAAAESGSADAMFGIARIYEDGLGVSADQETATGWYKRAVSAGSAQAASKLVERENQASRERIDGTSKPSNGTGNATPRDTPLTESEIRELQQLLARLDLSPGPATGELNAATISALKLYQSFAGLPEDGNPTADLLRDLRQVVGAMSDKPRAK